MKKWSIIMIIICFVLFILSIFYSQKKIKDQHKEFRNIKLSDEIEEKIVDIYIEKGACFVSLGHDKVFLHALPNNIYPERYLSEVLSIGDSLDKRTGSDSLFIYKSNKYYVFKLIFEK